MSRILTYGIETVPDDNGTLLVTCPAFPEVTTFGPNDPDELVSIARAAIEEAIAARISTGEALPRPLTKAELRRRNGLHVRLSLL